MDLLTGGRVPEAAEVLLKWRTPAVLEQKLSRKVSRSVFRFVENTFHNNCLHIYPESSFGRQT